MLKIKIIFFFACLSRVSAIFFRNIGINYASPTYDFVIVGSGSSGSVLARRLSEVPHWRILLLEVGPRPNIANDVPFIAPALQYTDYAWQYKMEKTPNVCLGMKQQQCPWPRGRGLGGTTLINYMIYTRGHRKDYDRWAAQGNPGWSYDEVLPYFLKSENANLRFIDDGYHSEGGPLSVEDVRWRSKVVDSFITGAKELGYPYIDYNGRSQDGFSYVQANTLNGIRHSGYRAFIQPAETRPNLHILTESRATRLLINPETKHVYGVEYVQNRRYHYVNVTKEVILSAGAFNSPQLLMLSGIGPRSHLESLSIPVLQDLPVGRNLQDHLSFLGMIYTYESGDTGLPTPEGLTSIETMLNWLKRGRGPLVSLGGVEALGYINTNTSDEFKDYPDMEIIMINGRFSVEVADIVARSLGLSDEVVREIFPVLTTKNCGIFLPMHLKPKSVGYLELKSRDPYHWPRFYGNALTDSGNQDVKAFISAIRFIQKLVQTKSYKKFNTTYADYIIPGCRQITFDTDEFWECALRHVTTTLHHQVGTCKMGPNNDPTSVVDHELKVHGISGLRVADTSVIPFALNAHTNAPTYMIGEKTADIIKKTWNY